MKAPHQILTAQQMRDAEQALFDAGETSQSLMEIAGQGAADWVWRMSAGRPVTVLCGPGNNGGDGYVIARSLAERRVDVSVIAPIDPGTEAAQDALRKWGGEPVADARGYVFVDCLFGTGLSRPLSDDLAKCLRDTANGHALKVAVDMPSGIDSDTGAALNDGLPHYDLTIALGAWKRAHWLMPASSLMGERRLVDIGAGADPDALQLAQRLRLFPPAPNSHKYSRGLLAVIGGDMPGAAILAATAAQHSGVGYVKLVAPHAHPAMPADLVHVDSDDPSDVLEDARLDAVLMGPGLGRGEGTDAKLRQVLAADTPLVLDADALAILDSATEIARPEAILATPHEGELAQMCKAFGIDAETKIEKARALHEATGMTILAKGADNILAGASGTLLFPPTSEWLSTAGTGDVLAGITASRMACGVEPFDAAQQAVFIHAEAARLAGTAFSACDLVRSIPSAYATFL
ncbi:NAD(P)H-hydrate dehydratase [Aurantiacibacter poecillastricola]|uniref:NAD(P)H-hydrate dehydratase n=1 Tax=Aurantiacibacter poecillastricola TaxID=3064385 RepID=UPI00273FD4B4|nr:NAD(P)H-hydrate dehydratase [Aurantiacibacter sp. 219JJ12-13]MDP5262173.1 NAD(P)H-hydrate dehydratase [Aurantiacibacter sp. 219JJ12-13]